MKYFKKGNKDEQNKINSSVVILDNTRMNSPMKNRYD